MKIARILKSFVAIVLLIAAGTICAADNPTASLAAPSNALTPDQVKQVQQIIHDYLVKNPQILVEVSQALQQQEMTKTQAKAGQVISENAKALTGDNSPSMGNAAGKITIVEFFDYQCPHCKDMTKITDNLLKKNANIRIVFKEFPIFGNSSVMASKIALAAAKQGKYSEFHHALMAYQAKQGRLTTEEVMDVAKSVGLNIDQLKKDMNDSTIEDQLKANYELAQKLGIMGTPAFIVVSKDSNDKPVFIPGETTEENLQKAITDLSK